MHKPIYVTKPNLPPLEEFIPSLEKIWNSRILTNGGDFHVEFERGLCDYLGVRHISLFSNATIGLITALQALKISGDVITTPYSFVATSHALLWNRLNPIFVDINPVTLNINPELIERAITPKTTAILAVHVYGTPCDTEAINKIAQKYKLKVIYDAAHAFGVKKLGNNLFDEGDLSVLSFHATKVFNTFEGGAIVSRSAEEKKHIDQLKNFGFVNETLVVECGINGKMNEFSAALGVMQLKDIDSIIEKRRRAAARYRKLISDIPGINMLSEFGGVYSNASYFPIFVTNCFPVSRDCLYEALKKKNIYARRYFYPLITSFSMYENLPSADPRNLSVAKYIADQVICLPISPDISESEQLEIVDIIREAR